MPSEKSGNDPLRMTTTIPLPVRRTRTPTDLGPTLSISPRLDLKDGSEEVRVLLRKRLLFFAYLLSVGFVTSVTMLLITDLPIDGWVLFAIGCFALGAVVAVVLTRNPSLSLKALRLCELAIFGSLYLQWTLVHGFLYPRLRLEFQGPMWFGFIVGYAVSVPWIFLILSYGILIPNTGRRCALIVGIMVITPLIVSKVSGLAARSTVGYAESNFFFILSLLLLMAAALSIYSSVRIDRLRREVAAARQLGQYQLLEQIGAGGMGEVYLAEHLLLRRPCAVKTIRPDAARNPKSLDLFEREVQVTAQLTHPNTVQVYDYGRTADGTFYYAMEYLPGLTLEQLVRQNGAISPERTVHFLKQICGALSEAHKAGLIHRDIKPGNILICERGGRPDVAKLLDFGLVGALNAGEGNIVGTPQYMSPEQASGRSLDARSDLYSLGAVGYFLLCGEPPFANRTIIELLRAHISEAIPFPDTVAVPEQLKAIILRCLSKDPAERYPDATSLDQALSNCLM